MTALDRALRRVGVQPRPFRALLRAFVLLDLRGHFYALATNVGAKEAIPPLYWVFGQFLTVSALLTALLQARAEAAFQAMAHLTTTALFVGAAVVVELQEAVLDPRDVDVVAHRPVTGRTWSLARLLNLVGYVGMLTLALAIIPVVVVPPDAAPGFAVRMAVAELATAVLAASVAVLLASLVDPKRLETLRLGLAWVQIVAILVLVYGGQLVIRNGDGKLERFMALPPPWLGALPTTVLGQAVADGTMRPLALACGLALVAAMATVVRLGSAWWALAASEPRTHEVRLPPPSVPGLFAARWVRALSGRGPAAGVHQLVATVLARDAELTTRLLALLALPVSAGILGTATGQFADPRTARAGDGVLPVAMVVLLASTLAPAMAQLRGSRTPDAAWHLAGIWGPRVRDAARLALLLRFYVPLLGVLAIALLLAWRDPLGAAVHVGTGALILDVLSRPTADLVLERPLLSAPPQRGSGFGAHMVTSIAVGSAATVLGGLWWAAASRGGWLLAGLVGALLVIDVALARRRG